MTSDLWGMTKVFLAGRRWPVFYAQKQREIGMTIQREKAGLERRPFLWQLTFSGN
jgi:hypothetical protein